MWHCYDGSQFAWILEPTALFSNIQHGTHSVHPNETKNRIDGFDGRLDDEFVLERLQEFHVVCVDDLWLNWSDWLSLLVNLLLTLCLCFSALCVPLLDKLLKVLPAPGLADVLDPEMEPLWNVSVSDCLHDFYADGAPGDVEDLRGLSMVVLVGHTLLLGGVCSNVYVLTDLEGLEVCGGVLRPMLSEGTAEEVSRVAAFTVGSHHGDLFDEFTNGNTT
eukprot:CAMPEP_0184696216 /NCGR_PEP_ID=MMETSP0313-20130426/3578_1 /TAXON_ID=2792 /ORGANISM="Porphyridium aerugineum, Strain SAG 1380-2" /LENGTH=218 /DNA_ID=CAMNT_0027154793 /DNA_START=51 /DNA_END=707 /DNA_ORIENTATION=+